jgi:hypothetical protein
MADAKRNSTMARVLLHAVGCVFSLLPPWTSIPIAIIGGNLIYFFWAARVSSVPSLSHFGFYLGAGFAMITLAAGYEGHEFRRNRGQSLAQEIGLSWLNHLSLEEMENLVAGFYRQQGYAVEEFDENKDRSFDLALWKGDKRTLVQFKRWKTHSVDEQAVRELYEAQSRERAQRSILITAGGYAKEALRFAEGKSLELIDGPQWSDMVQQLRKTMAAAVVAANASANEPVHEPAALHPVHAKS